MDGKAYYTVTTAAQHLIVSKDVIYSMIASGELPALRIGRQYRISAEDMERFEKRKKKETAEYLRGNRLGAFLPGR